MDNQSTPAQHDLALISINVTMCDIVFNKTSKNTLLFFWHIPCPYILGIKKRYVQSDMIMI